MCFASISFTLYSIVHLLFDCPNTVIASPLLFFFSDYIFCGHHSYYVSFPVNLNVTITCFLNVWFNGLGG